MDRVIEMCDKLDIVQEQHATTYAAMVTKNTLSLSPSPSPFINSPRIPRPARDYAGMHLRPVNKLNPLPSQKDIQDCFDARHAEIETVARESGIDRI